jgi:hypothetical protein
MKKLLFCFTAICVSAWAQTSYIDGSLTTEGSVNYCGSASVTSNAYTCTDPAGATIASYQIGKQYLFRPTTANTGPATLSIDGLTAIAIRKAGGTTDLALGDLVAGSIVSVLYDGTVFELSASGATTFNPAYTNNNTSTTSSMVVIGDSHMSGLGQTTSIPARLTPTNSYTVTDLAVGGTKFCAYWADHGTKEAQVDSYYNPLARSNLLILEGGGNDMIDNNSGIPSVPWITAQQVYDCEKSYALRRKAVGWTIILYPMYSRTQTGIGGLTGDQLHDALNALYDAGWHSFADAYMPHSPDTPAVWNDGDNTGACFNADHIHVLDTCAATLASQLTTVVNQAEAGTVNLLNAQETIQTNEAASQLVLQNQLASDFTTINYRGSGSQQFLEGMGNPSSTAANKFFVYDLTNGAFRFLIDSAGNSSFPTGTTTVNNLLVSGTCTGCGTGGSGGYSSITQDATTGAITITNGASFPLILHSTNGGQNKIYINNPNSTTGGFHDFDFGSDPTDAFILYDDTINVPLWDVSSGGNRFSVAGGLQVNQQGMTKISCTAGNGGTFWYTGHTTGVKDSVEVCAADASNVYAWRTIY